MKSESPTAGTKCASNVSSRANKEVALPSSFSKKLCEVQPYKSRDVKFCLPLCSLYGLGRLAYRSNTLHFSSFLGFIRFIWLGFALFSLRRPPFFSLDLSFLFHFPFTHEKHKRKRLLLLENTRPQGVNGFWDFATSLFIYFWKTVIFLCHSFLVKKKSLRLQSHTQEHNHHSQVFSHFPPF